MYRRAVDYADPSGLDAMPMDCISATSASLSQTARAVGCAGRAPQVYEQASTNTAQWATHTFPLLDPLRTAFALGTGPLRRGMGLTALVQLGRNILAVQAGRRDTLVSVVCHATSVAGRCRTQTYLSQRVLASLVGWVGHGIGLIAVVARSVGAVTNVTRGAEAAMDTATLDVSDASPSEGGVAAVHTTTADTQTSGGDADDVVDFAHGTTRASAADIMVNGLSYEAGLKNMAGSVEPGSFFTIRIDPSDPSEALSTAAFWAKRHDGPLCVLICRLPQSVVEDLEGGGALIHTVGPTQSIFRPASFDAVDRAAAWVVVNFER